MKSRFAHLHDIEFDEHLNFVKYDKPRVQNVKNDLKIGISDNTENNLLDKFSQQQKDEWSCKLLSWRRKIHSLAKGNSLSQAEDHARYCGQGIGHSGKFRKLAASNTCGHCNNFGYKCVVKIENADNKVDGEMAEYPRKEPESGVCMWSKKCDNAQCVLRYNSKSSRWEILSTRSSNKVAYYRSSQEKDPNKVDLSSGWEKGEIGTNANPASMKVHFTCTSYQPPSTCNQCDHLYDASCLSRGERWNGASSATLLLIFLYHGVQLLF